MNEDKENKGLNEFNEYTERNNLIEYNCLFETKDQSQTIKIINEDEDRNEETESNKLIFCSKILKQLINMNLSRSVLSCRC